MTDQPNYWTAQAKHCAAANSLVCLNLKAHQTAKTTAEILGIVRQIIGDSYNRIAAYMLDLGYFTSFGDDGFFMIKMITETIHVYGNRAPLIILNGMFGGDLDTVQRWARVAVHELQVNALTVNAYLPNWQTAFAKYPSLGLIAATRWETDEQHPYQDMQSASNIPYWFTAASHAFNYDAGLLLVPPLNNQNFRYVRGTFQEAWFVVPYDHKQPKNNRAMIRPDGYGALFVVDPNNLKSPRPSAIAQINAEINGHRREITGGPEKTGITGT